MRVEVVLLLAVQLVLVAHASLHTRNAVIPNQNVPDPGAIVYQGAYYVATTTNLVSDPDKFPIHKSYDLQNWTLVGYVFPSNNIPSWSGPNSDFWAPELHIVNGQFRVYYTSREVSSGILCIGVAHADNLLGPYTDIGRPLIKNTTVGSIDCTITKSEEGNSYYLVWKDDGNGNNPQIPTWIWAQQLTDDGLDVFGPKTQLIRNTLPWEADVVEAPWIIKLKGCYYLFYSGHCYCDSTYAVGVARSKHPLGPYEKKGDPILKTNNLWIGPGHCSVIPLINDNLIWVMIYHSWIEGAVCGNNNRVLMVDEVYWADDWPFMHGGSPTPSKPSLSESFA